VTSGAMKEKWVVTCKTYRNMLMQKKEIIVMKYKSAEGKI